MKLARAAMEIAADPSRVYAFTRKSRRVALLSDGSAVLGLGEIGPFGVLPLLEASAARFAVAELEAVPIALDTTDTDEIVESAALLAPSFGAIVLEGIALPRCFAIESRLIERLEIPVMHGDRHGPAIVILAALMDAAARVGKELHELRIVAAAGSDPAGTATIDLLSGAGLREVVSIDRNTAMRTDAFADALEGTDAFIGIAAPVIPQSDQIARMARDPVLIAIAEPPPQIAPEVLEKLAVLAIGPDQASSRLNGLAVVPGILRGVLDAGARRVGAGMKLAAARAIAARAGLPLDDPRMARAIADAVGAAAVDEGLVRRAMVKESSEAFDPRV